MRAASSYRGARRNEVRLLCVLGSWRESGAYADAANTKAKLNERAVQANNAREAASVALVKHGVLGFHRRADVLVNAFLTFYRNEKRTRVVNRIVRDLERQSRAA